jgi:hypothetical protein
MKSVNPLNIHEVRRTLFCPPYFEKAPLPCATGGPSTRGSGVVNRLIVSWVNDNLTGRFYIGLSVDVTSKFPVRTETYIAFENPSELTIFMLSCPHLN